MERYKDKRMRNVWESVNIKKKNEWMSNVKKIIGKLKIKKIMT